MGIDGSNVFDAGFGIRERCGGGFVAVVVRCQGIHAYSPDERSLAFGVANICQEIRGGDVNGRVVAGCGGAV